MENILSKNPATGETLAEHRSFDPAQINEAVERARVAQKWWGQLNFSERSSYLLRGKNYLLEHMDEIARSISMNNGKPLVEALAEILPMIQTVTFAQKKAPKILKDKKIWLGMALPTKMATLSYRPLGVVGIISPWNYPLSTPLAEVFLGLAAGNAIILKPSEVTGLVNDEIQKVMDSMRLPENVFTMIHGRGDVGAALASSSVDRVIVTGSVSTGKKVMEAASQRLTPVSLELGGKDCMIVLEDADVELAASAALTGSLYNTGQTCCSVERLLVHERIKGPFIEAFTRKMGLLRQGDSQSFDIDMGAVTFEGQKKVYRAQSEDWTRSQGKSLFGEANYDGQAPFMKPLVVEAREDSLFWKEETFGPVVAVKTFASDEEAARINNDTAFGLTAMICSKNVKRARNLARQLNVGTVVINDAPFTNAVPQLPWGGVRESGFGWVHGEAGLKDLCHLQVAVYDIFAPQKQFWWFPHSKAQYDFFKSYAVFLEGKGFKNRWDALRKMLRALSKMGPRL